MRKWNIIITILLFVLGTICFIFFDVRPITILGDALANKLLTGFVARFGLSLVFGWMLYQYGGRKYLLFDRKFPKYLLWALPCLMVGLVNFPVSALINGQVTIVRTDLLGLYAIYVISVALLEELIFRGVLLIIVSDYLRNTKHKYLFTALICAAVFSLFHLTNLFVGMSISYVLLQCLYTFLIGGMLMITMFKTKNIWLCVLAHAIFDFGGLLTSAFVEEDNKLLSIAVGDPWESPIFWVLTIVMGVLCAGHCVYSLLKLEKDYVSE